MTESCGHLSMALRSRSSASVVTSDQGVKKKAEARYGRSGSPPTLCPLHRPTSRLLEVVSRAYWAQCDFLLGGFLFRCLTNGRRSSIDGRG
jgi:hypothetical protein